jgi:hypothetical protein
MAVPAAPETWLAGFTVFRWFGHLSSAFESSRLWNQRQHVALCGSMKRPYAGMTPLSTVLKQA